MMSEGEADNKQSSEENPIMEPETQESHQEQIPQENKYSQEQIIHLSKASNTPVVDGQVRAQEIPTVEDNNAEDQGNDMENHRAQSVTLAEVQQDNDSSNDEKKVGLSDHGLTLEPLEVGAFG